MKILETLKFIGRIRSNKNRQRGFTLIELVVVLAVLGVLAAIGIPQLTGLQENARISGAATNFSSEVGNLFAEDLANDEAGTDGGNFNWSAGSICETLNGSPDSFASLYEDGATSDSDSQLFAIETGANATVEVTVPTYDDGDIGQETCGLVSGDSGAGD